MTTKKCKSLVLAGALSLGAASLASAAQYVYITGSTAGRAFVYATLADTTVFDAAPSVVTQGGSGNGATYMNFSGNIGGVATIVKCHWSGSEGGIADLAGGTQQFLDDAATTGGSGPYVSQTVDIAMADNAVLYSKNPSVAATGKKVGVIPFKWVKQKGSSASLVNVTDQNLRAALNGDAKLALFTGNPADTTRVYVSGRDNNSGTRVNTFGTCGFGIFSSPSMVQVNTNGAMLRQADGNYVGDYGYSGGGTLAAQMGYDLTQAPAIDLGPLGDGTSHYSVIAYMGVSDANVAVNNGGTVLSYNGVPFSVAAIEQGLYNFWGNYYIYRKSTVSSQATTVYNKLSGATGISAHADDVGLIKLTSMSASRVGPTTDPVHN